MAPQPVLRPPAVDEAESIEGATRAELDAVGRLSSSAGRTALQLARRLDVDGRDTGMGYAALVRAHQQAMAEAVKGASVADDPVDELRARRDRKRAG